jgi:hypothetical protein
MTSMTMVTSRRWLHVGSFLLLALTQFVVQGHVDDHRYNKEDHVELWVNKVT